MMKWFIVVFHVYSICYSLVLDLHSRWTTYIHGACTRTTQQRREAKQVSPTWGGVCDVGTVPTSLVQYPVH
ncbi:hypothetical protein F5Y03DRAFT_364652 [Xylaria venustula]|nr:hypothetical protein F5Y03DRAFT_364652 [Xylaria venustula]